MVPFRFIAGYDTAINSTPWVYKIDKGVRAIRIVADVPVYYGTDPANLSIRALLPAGVPEYFLVSIGDTVLVTAQGQAGNANITFLTH